MHAGSDGKAASWLPQCLPQAWSMHMQRSRAFDKENWLWRFNGPRGAGKWADQAKRWAGNQWLLAFDAATGTYSAANLRNYYSSPENRLLLEQWSKDVAQHYKLRVLDEASSSSSSSSLAPPRSHCA